MHPVRKGGGLFWDRALLPEEVFADRYRRLQAAIVAAGDDGWLVYGDVARCGDLVWTTHYLPAVRFGLAIVPRQGPPTLLAALDPDNVVAAATLTWVSDVRPARDLPTAFGALLAERRLVGRFGLVGLEAGQLGAAAEGMRFVPRDAEMAVLRPARQLAERNAVRRAGNGVERGLMVARHVLRAGITMQQVTALIDREMRREGAEDVRILVAAGEQTRAQLRPPDDRRLRAHDVVMLYLAAQVQRYWIEAAQTLVVGSASPALRTLANKAWRAVVGMEANARPDARVTAVAAAARKEIGAGPAWECACTYGLGHGIGLDAHEPPVIAPDSTETVAREAVLAFCVVLQDGNLGAIAGGSYIIQPRESVPLVSHPPLVECSN